MSTSVFQTRADYPVPLLRLLSTLEGGQGQADEVIRLFGERYGDDVPAQRYKIRSNGKPGWTHRVRWAWRDLKNRGLMDAPARGVWRITEAGRQWLEDHPEATRLEPGRSTRRTRSRRRRAATPPGVTLEQLKATKAAMPPDQFRQVWGELYDQSLAQERARSKTTISNRELGTRASAVLREVHDVLDGKAASSPEKAYDWMQFCYALGLYRETAALFAFVFQDDLPEWVYERARKVAEACRARLG